MTNYDENLRKVADALFVKADPKADQNVWDMAREVLKTVPQKEFRKAPGWTNVGTPVAPQWVKEPHTATNYFAQASQPVPPLPQWLMDMSTPVPGDPDTIIIDPSKVRVNLAADPVLQELANVMPSAEDMPNAYKRLGQRHDALLRDQLAIRRITEAAGDGGPQGENQRESTVGAVKRVRAALKSALIDQGMVRSVLEAADDVTTLQVAAARMKEIKDLKETVNMLSNQLLEIRQCVGGHKTLVVEVADMAKENNDLRAKANDIVEGTSATKLLKLVERFSGMTLLDKVRSAVEWAGSHQANAKRLQDELDQVRRILGASEADSGLSGEHSWYTEHESTVDAATRVMGELNEATEANIKHSCEKEMAAKAREIRAAFADQLAEEIKTATRPRQPSEFAQWLHNQASKERANKEMDKL